MRRVFLPGLLLAGVAMLFAGCAVQPPAAAVELLHPGSRIVVLQLPAAVSDQALQKVLHPDDEKISAAALTADRSDLQRSMETSLERALDHAANPALASAVVAPLAPAQPMDIGLPLDPTALAALNSQYPADAYLRLRVTDYGQTPGSWKSAYITFEVVTTVAIGTALYVHKATRPLAGIYLLEEGVEEYSEGYAGWWLLNRLSRPVRIDADLVDGRSGQVMWHDSQTGMASWQWQHLWHMDDATRDTLLQTSSDHALDDLLRELGGR